MYTQIMVPLDGSDLAERALPCAQRLAAVMGATLHVVRVVEPPAPPARVRVPINAYNTFMREQIAEAHAYLTAVRARLSQDTTPVQTVHLVGECPDALLSYEQRAGIDLVVMCSHGRSGAARLLLGSVAASIVKYGAAPVLLVRACGEPVDLEHAIVPLDGSPRAEAALHVLAGLAGSVIRWVHLLRVIDAGADGPGAEAYLVEVCQRLAPLGLACTTEVAWGDPAERIIARAGQTDLVLMATHGRTGIVRWTLGSVADRVARGGVAAVLLLRGEGTGAVRSARDEAYMVLSEPSRARRAYAMGTRLPLPFAASLEATRTALHGQGFHILAEIDMSQAVHERLQVVLHPAVILCIYHPDLASQALQVDPGSSLLLVREVLVYESEKWTSTVEVLDPEGLLACADEHAGLVSIVHDARVRLQQVLDILAAAPSTDA
jgi:nucleotide-binding universal stress UspA family protein/uncharacterized protein (DUF302 family)